VRAGIICPLQLLQSTAERYNSSLALTRATQERERIAGQCADADDIGPMSLRNSKPAQQGA